MARRKQSAGQKKDSPAVLRLNRKLYTKVAVQAAVADFRRVCRCSLASNKRFYVLKLRPNSGKSNKVMLAGELANYALALMKNLPREQ
jgi:hypothetical protein